MLAEVRKLSDGVRAARERLIRELEGLSAAQGAFMPGPEAWSVAEVVEHLVWAEQSGLNKMWVALAAARRGEPVWVGEHPERRSPIETIIERTWRPKEQAPAIAEPSWGGPLSYWLAFFGLCQTLTEAVAAEIRAEELDEVVYPHYLSGPLTLRQRLEFIRYHIERHRLQIESILALPDFPRARR